MHGYFLWNDCVVIRLQMENLMVEVVISLVVLCVGNCDGYLLFLVVMGIFFRVSLCLSLLVSSPQLW
jgi:hypothetical protein